MALQIVKQLQKQINPINIMFEMNVNTPILTRVFR